MTGVSLLLVLAAVCGLIAAGAWFKVARSIDTSGDVVTGPDKRALGHAAFATSLAIGLASVAALIEQAT